MQESAKDKNSVSQISKTCITFCIKIPSKEVQTIPKIYIKQKNDRLLLVYRLSY